LLAVLIADTIVDLLPEILLQTTDRFRKRGVVPVVGENRVFVAGKFDSLHGAIHEGCLDDIGPLPGTDLVLFIAHAKQRAASLNSGSFGGFLQRFPRHAGVAFGPEWQGRLAGDTREVEGFRTGFPVIPANSC